VAGMLAPYLEPCSRFRHDNPMDRFRQRELASLTLSPRRAIPALRKTLTLSQNNIGMLTTPISHLALVGE